MKKIRKINRIFIVLILANLICCQSVKNESKNIDKIGKIQIKSVDFSIMTIISVECNQFEEYFSDCRTVIITETELINKLIDQLSNLDPMDSNYKVDIRARIDLFHEDYVDTICVGYLTLRINNEIYKTPQELIDFIEAKCNSDTISQYNNNYNHLRILENSNH